MKILESSRTLPPHSSRVTPALSATTSAQIDGSKKQVQYGAKQGVPSIPLIYNNIDPVFQMFGTEDMDFTAAMYGEYAILLNRDTKGASDWFNGKNQSLQQHKNTPFSGVGRLSDRAGKATVTLFENVFCKEKVPYEKLPSCFEVRRVEVSSELSSFA